MSETVTVQNYTRLAERTERIPTGDTEIDPSLVMVLFGAFKAGLQTGSAFDDLKRALIYGQSKDPTAIMQKFGDVGWESPTKLTLTPTQYRMLHASFGMITEAFEFFETVVANIQDGKPFDPVNLKEEVGDTFWYSAIPANLFDFKLEDAMARNIEKLRVRYPGKFNLDNAVNRDLAAEREALEKPSDQS